METLMKLLGEAETVAILGHVHPDGDCVGSCLGMYNYLADNFGKLSVRVFLEPVSEKFSYLRYFDRIENDLPESLEVDLCISLDASDRERLGAYDAIFSRAKKTFCIDHHITNPGFAQENHVVPGASSACEVLFGLLDETKIGRETAECLYTGIVHDTGVFKHNNTTGKTMAIAGRLLDKGLDGERIIDDSFFKKSYVQNQILGRALLESILFMDGKCIFTVVKARDMEFLRRGQQRPGRHRGPAAGDRRRGVRHFHLRERRAAVQGKSAGQRRFKRGEGSLLFWRRRPCEVRPAVP